CQKYSAVVAKVIRIRTISPALAASGVKIVELLRNPKAVVLSRLHTDGFDPGKSPGAIASEVCGAMASTYRQVREVVDPSRYCSVRLEDVALTPDDTMAMLYRCLGFGLPPPQTGAWISGNMLEDGAEARNNSRYAETRNATEVALHWAERWTDLTANTKQEIDDACGGAVAMLGYSAGW
ncbi:unnamed protein product, partial [Phaeothamnion confervicola]